MLDLRMAAAALAIFGACISVALAEPARDRVSAAGQVSQETRPVRVVLPALWEAAKPPAEQLPPRRSE